MDGVVVVAAGVDEGIVRRAACQRARREARQVGRHLSARVNRWWWWWCNEEKEGTWTRGKKAANSLHMP